MVHFQQMQMQTAAWSMFVCVFWGVPQSLLTPFQKMTLRVVDADVLLPLRANGSLYIH